MSYCGSSQTGVSTARYYYTYYYDTNVSSTIPLDLEYYDSGVENYDRSSSNYTTSESTFLSNTWSTNRGQLTTSAYTKATNYYDYSAESEEYERVYAFKFSDATPSYTQMGSGRFLFSISNNYLIPFPSNSSFEWYVDGSNVGTGATVIVDVCYTSTSGYKHTIYAKALNASHYGNSSNLTVCTNSAAASSACCTGNTGACTNCISSTSGGPTISSSCLKGSKCFAPIETAVSCVATGASCFTSGLHC